MYSSWKDFAESADRYLTCPGDVVRAEPSDALEIDLSLLWDGPPPSATR